ncbi:MAG: tail fiber domain-containing protein, partial [Bacteroidota bacterium]
FKVLDNSGNVGIGNANPAAKLDVNGQCVNTFGSWSKRADMTLKEAVNPFKDGLEQVLKINPITYRFKEEHNLGREEHVGVSAQELQEVAPYMVGKSKMHPEAKEDHLTMDPGPLTYMLINAVKELHAEVESLKKQITR